MTTLRWVFMKNLLSTIVAAVILIGCSDRTADGVKNAKGQTPVKYVICSPGETLCFVSARFKDLDSCESHKEWSVMLCDKRSTPGKMICTQDTGAQISSAYCTL